MNFVEKIKNFKNKVFSESKTTVQVPILHGNSDYNILFGGLPIIPPQPSTDNMTPMHDWMFFEKNTQTLKVSKILDKVIEFHSYQSELSMAHPQIKIEVLDDDSFQRAKVLFLSKNGGREANPVQASKFVSDARKMLALAKERGASDIHIDTINGGRGKVRFRIGGSLEEITELQQPEEFLMTLYNVLAKSSDTTYVPDKMQNATIVDKKNMPEGMVGVRIVRAPHYNGTYMVMRLQCESLMEDSHLSIVERLIGRGYTLQQAYDWQRIMRKNSGIVIICGKVGSGKTNTLSVIAEAIQKENPGKLIQTVENPIEIPIQGVRQLSIKTGYESNNENMADSIFTQGISVALRSDPNILVISEVRRPDEALAAFQGADTGHLLFTTLHANTALSGLSRFQSLLPASEVPDPFLHMSDPAFMSGACYQRLVQVLCPYCKIPLEGHESKMEEGLLERIVNFVGDDHEKYSSIYLKGEGCPHCNGKGYKGRTVIAEVICFDAALLSVYGRTRNISEVKKAWIQNGGISFRQVGMQRVLAGMLSPQEYEENCGDIGEPEIFEDEKGSKMEKIFTKLPIQERLIKNDKVVQPLLSDQELVIDNLLHAGNSSSTISYS